MSMPNSEWFQTEIVLPAFSRGCHLITSHVLRELPHLRRCRMGLMHVFIQHTSASLALNENADPSVRDDMEAFFTQLIPGNTPYFTHTYEGDDDMPAHLKQVLIGPSVLVPIHKGQLALGTWQGIYLCEHRDQGGSRRVVITLWGESAS